MVGTTVCDGDTAQVPRLRLGFVGAINLPQVQSALSARLRALWSLTVPLVPGRPIRLVSGMADGADRCAIESFIDWRGDDAHEVLMVYPCAPEAFRECSGLRDPSAFDALRERLLLDGRAGELALDGAMPRSAHGTASEGLLAHEKRVRSRSHELQAEILLRQCDVLIAVLDGHAAGDEGGTRQTVLRALALGMPVLLLDAGCTWMPKDRLDLVRPADAGNDAWEAAWKVAITRRDTAASDRVAPRTHSVGVLSVDRHGRSDGHVHSGRRDLLADVDALIAGTVKPSMPEVRGWGLMQRYWTELGHRHAAALERAYLAEDAVATPAPVAAHDWSSWEFLRAAIRSCSPGDKVPQGATRADEDTSERWRRRISKIQDSEMRTYRGLYLQGYVLGLIAVGLALSALFLLAFSAGPPGLSVLIPLIVIAFVKLWVVGKIQRHTHRAHENAHGDNAIALRHLVEQLRVLPMLRLAGSTRLDLVRRDLRRTRAAEAADAICARLPLQDCAIAHDSQKAMDTAISLLTGQCRYHLGVHAAMDAMHRVLDRVSRGAGKAVVAIVVVDIALLIAKLATKTAAGAGWIDDLIAEGLSHALTTAGLIAVILTALLPALMATANAIQFQSVCEQLADRHGAMAATIAELRREGRELIARIGDPGAYGAAGIALEFAERSAALLTAEVAEWGAMYRQDIKEA
jgi:hypothetical protein